jgi:hypothetical protein
LKKILEKMSIFLRGKLARMKEMKFRKIEN